MKIRRTLVGAGAVAGLLAATLALPAQADTNTTAATALPAVGSDTIDELTNQLSLLPSLNTDLANYTAVPAGTNIDTSGNFRPVANTACASFLRPNGSGNGKNALVASMSGGTVASWSGIKECVGVARSSNNTFPAGPPTGHLARIPVALDAVAPAVRNNSTIGKKFSLSFLKSVYTRNGAAGTAACLGVVPLLPQSGSGTRGFWASALGITDYDFSGTASATGTPANPPAAGTKTWGSCVTGGAARIDGTNNFGTAAGNGQPADRSGTPTGAAIQEHDGRFLTASNMIAPYSIGQYIVEGSGVIGDIRGSAVLASVDFTTVGNDTTPASYTAVNANTKHPYTINDASNATTFQGAQGNLTRQVFFFVPRALYDSAFTPTAPFDGFGTTTTADRDRFKQAFANGLLSDICDVNTITLYGFSPQPDCGTPTLN